MGSDGGVGCYEGGGGVDGCVGRGGGGDFEGVGEGAAAFGEGGEVEGGVEEEMRSVDAAD